MRPTALLIVLACAVGTGLVGCASGPDPLLAVARHIPMALSEDGLLLRRGAVGSDQLAAELAVDAADVRASATTGVPALRVLLAPAGQTVTALEDAGFLHVDAPEGWAVLVRPDGGDGFAGIPAVAVGEDVVAVGDRDQLELLVSGGRPLPLPERMLDGAEVALARGAVPAQDGLPPIDAAVVTAGPQGDGVMALRLAGPGEQSDAVDLSVRLRTAGPVTAAGTPVVDVGGALTEDDVVTVELVWRTDAAAVLRDGIDASPLGVLDG